MKFKVESFIQELLDHSIIDQSMGTRIREHYQNKQSANSSNRLLSIFGILGAFLVGTGIILIVAHNWDDLSRLLKCTMSFIPVIIGILACCFSLVKKSDNFTWNEASSIFLTFAIGACIALISQVYNIPGSPADYMLTWSILALPLVYLMNSSITSLLYIIGINSVGLLSELPQTHYFWLLLLLILPFYYKLYQQNSTSNSLMFHHWFIPLAIMLNIIRGGSSETGWLILPTLIILFGFYYLISQTSYLNKLALFANGYRVIGSAGIVVILLITSFHEVWKDLAASNLSLSEYLSDYLFIIAFTTAVISIFIAFRYNLFRESWLNYIWIVFVPVFILGFYSPIASTVIINLLLLVFAILVVIKGINTNHLGIINYGLLVIAILVGCRFFDINIPFFLRGLIFISLGIVFFLINYKLIQTRKSNANE